MLQSKYRFSCIVSDDEEGMRLDQFLVRHMADFSRSALSKLIVDGSVTVNGDKCKAGYRIRQSDSVNVVIPEPEPADIVPEKIDFPILHEDDSLLVLVKPPGIVVHPAAGHATGTLVHGLLFHCNSLPWLADNRPGIVHRLDKDTSGIMLVAKDDNAMAKLTSDFRNRNVKKIYHAMLLRSPGDEEGRIVAAIGRHPVKRKKMAVTHGDKGRFAATNWKIIHRFENGMCFTEIGLETGRTHQIRVHMASIGCPVAGDPLYGGMVSDSYKLNVRRQLLHSSVIEFVHPVSREKMSFTAPLWEDMQKILDTLHEKEKPV